MKAAELPGAWAVFEAALRERRPVHVTYHGCLGLVCPHALGWKAGRPMVLAYQSGGGTTTGALDPDPRKRWRCMYVDEVNDVVLDRPSAWQSAENYNPSHPFNTIDTVSPAVS